MNKIIKYLKNIVLLINTLLLVYLLTNVSSFSGLTQTYFFEFILYVVLTLTLFIKDIKNTKRHSPIVDDIKYNSILLLSQSIILFIVVRNYLDPNLFLTLVDNVISKSPGDRAIFLANNFIYLNIMNFCLVLYNYINNK